MADHTYEVAVTLRITGAEESEKEPIDHVVDAVRQLLQDQGDEWLLEAIGHPHPDCYKVTAVDGQDQADKAWMYEDLCK